ncbi:MAG: hypothetical protein AB8B51_18685 [Sedimentitalea sp.]
MNEPTSAQGGRALVPPNVKKPVPRAPWVAFLVTVTILGLFIGGFLGGFAGDAANPGASFAGTATALLLAAASVFVGGLIGFLFGIPISSRPGGAENDATSDNSFGHNTNLEQVSDFLTKILIGVTLTQFNDIFSALGIFANDVAPAFLPGSLGTARTLRAVAMAYIIFFAVSGFLFGYLWSRVELTQMFNNMFSRIQQKVKSTLDETEQRSLDDIRLQGEVEDYLTGASKLDDTQLKNLRLRIRGSDRASRTRLFFTARRHRLNTRIDHGDVRVPGSTDAMERAALIFEELIAVAPEEFHRNHGQLGYLLKDQAAPDYKQAQICLRKAIDLRGEARVHGHTTYEMSLAECLVNIAATASDPDVYVSKINELIETAALDQDIADWPSIRKWRQRLAKP